MDRISQNTIYAFILTRSKLGLSHIIFRTDTRVMIYAIILFQFNILRTNGLNFNKLYIYITINTDKIYVGIVSCHFSQIGKRVMALD